MFFVCYTFTPYEGCSFPVVGMSVQQIKDKLEEINLGEEIILQKYEETATLIKEKSAQGHTREKILDFLDKHINM